FNLRKSKKRLGWMNDAEVTAVANDLNVSKREVLEMESRLSGRDIGFDAPTDSDDDHAPPAPIAYLEQADADPAALFERENHDEKQLDALGEGLEALDARSRAILQRRFLGDEQKATLQELATEYGVSAERVRQIEATALKKLRGLLLA
ncbi:MAG: RNA polymerase sigma factor RpoH, partial [Xanthomonadaceae bacterium]|nr:RNA polymerase sigma factor RpoH [Xanthomonadaceae bacterium]